MAGLACTDGGRGTKGETGSAPTAQPGDGSPGSAGEAGELGGPGQAGFPGAVGEPGLAGSTGSNGQCGASGGGGHNGSATLGILYSKANTDKKLGLNVPGDWDDMIELMKTYNDLQTDQPASAFYTNDFVKG